MTMRGERRSAAGRPSATPPWPPGEETAGVLSDSVARNAGSSRHASRKRSLGGKKSVTAAAFSVPTAVSIQARASGAYRRFSRRAHAARRRRTYGRAETTRDGGVCDGSGCVHTGRFHATRLPTRRLHAGRLHTIPHCLFTHARVPGSGWRVSSVAPSKTEVSFRKRQKHHVATRPSPTCTRQPPAPQITLCCTKKATRRPRVRSCRSGRLAAVGGERWSRLARLRELPHRPLTSSAWQRVFGRGCDTRDVNTCKSRLHSSEIISLPGSQGCRRGKWGGKCRWTHLARVCSGPWPHAHLANLVRRPERVAFPRLHGAALRNLRGRALRSIRIEAPEPARLHASTSAGRDGRRSGLGGVHVDHHQALRQQGHVAHKEPRRQERVRIGRRHQGAATRETAAAPKAKVSINRVECRLPHELATRAHSRNSRCSVHVGCGQLPVMERAHEDSGSTHAKAPCISKRTTVASSVGLSVNHCKSKSKCTTPRAAEPQSPAQRR
eukprot:scaffold14840_cov101-Isochrysis_galbana.AAC.3